MEWLATLGRTMGFSLAAGVNLYATVALLGLASRYGWVALPEQFKIFDNSWIIGAAGVLYTVEFVADKDPVGRFHLGLGAHLHPARRRRRDCGSHARRPITGDASCRRAQFLYAHASLGDARLRNIQLTTFSSRTRPRDSGGVSLVIRRVRVRAIGATTIRCERGARRPRAVAL